MRPGDRDDSLACDRSDLGKAREAALAGQGAALARAHEEIGHSLRLANALNLDRRQTILDALTVLGSAKPV